METIAPTAQPGDICILVEPCLRERQRLYAAQAHLQSRFGGRVCSKVHVTCQRFNVKPPQRLGPIVDRFGQELATWQGFPIVADSLLSFHADFLAIQRITLADSRRGRLVSVQKRRGDLAR